MTNEVLAILRFFRNIKLEESDKPWGLADYDHPKKAEWILYRQQLRDLVANSPDATLDENNNLINVEWPSRPDELQDYESLEATP